jgi:HAD superfamily hydrolase (TIGR01509 family)
MSPRAPSPDPAVVFDLDGVLLESEIAWTRAETDLFARYGQPYGDLEKRLLIGGSLADTGRTLERLLDGVRTADQLVEELVELAAVEFARGVTPMPGAVELIDELRGRRPIAVASNSLRRLVDLALDGSGLDGAFDAVIAGDEVPQPKPAPDIYLEAARRLGSPPEQAVAIEDSPTGAAAARSAGMFVVGIPYLRDLVLDVDLVGRSLEDDDVRAALGLPPLSER